VPTVWVPPPGRPTPVPRFFSESAAGGPCHAERATPPYDELLDGSAKPQEKSTDLDLELVSQVGAHRHRHVLRIFGVASARACAAAAARSLGAKAVPDDLLRRLRRL
jgi:hypothetical protein